MDTIFVVVEALARVEANKYKKKTQEELATEKKKKIGYRGE